MSKELEALDNLTKGVYCPKGTELCTDCSICEKNTSISIIKKALKALEIIKEKRVDRDYLIISGNVETYNHYCDLTNRALTNHEYLTKAEFDLLKEWLK